jgi:hypothetical protein
MTKEEKQWLKENEPWRYDDLFGDPVTGNTNTNTAGAEVFFIILIALGVWGLISFIF